MPRTPCSSRAGRARRAAATAGLHQRAASTHPPTMEILVKLGLESRLMERGLISTSFRYFDRLSGQLVAEFDCGLLKNDTPYPYVFQHEQFKLVDTILSVLRGEAGF